MEINAALAAELATLTEALDGQGADVVEGLQRLATDVRASVASYLGLMVSVAGNEVPLVFTALDDHLEMSTIRSSLMVALPTPADAVPSGAVRSGGVRSGGVRSGGVRSGGVRSGAVPRISLILFASAAGAFVDLAADLAWMTGRQLSEVLVDQHVNLPIQASTAEATATMLRAASVINEALGVLIGQGHTPEQAHSELDTRAIGAGTDRHHAAALILSSLGASGPHPD